MRMRWLISLACVLLFGSASSQGDVIVYSPFNDEFMQALAEPFTEDTGSQVLNIVISTGESQSRLRAEAQRPQADVWLSVRPAVLHQAYEEELIEPYEPAGADTVLPAYQYDEAHIQAVGTYPLVFFYNSNLVEQMGIEPPSGDWDQLLVEEYADNVVMPHPATSGTARAALGTMLQMPMQAGGSEDDGWAYVSELNRSVAQFTRSGRAPQTLVAQGEYPVGIGFYDAVWQLQQEGFPLEVVVPDPVFAEPYGAALVAGGPNPEAARAFFDYLLTPTAQEILTQFGNYPIIDGVSPPEGGVSIPSEQVIDVPFQWLADNTDRLLERFQEETQAEPQ
ncbi:MAG: extracellular solute-binding protein [Trueperaceae bacterium]|nr:extracellular solute-binding protein [Trueperaceae bacterium]